MSAPSKIEQLEEYAADLDMTKEELREFARLVIGPLTVVTMYRADDAEFFCQLVQGQLTDEQRRQWRDAHGADKLTQEEADEQDAEQDNMFFRAFKWPLLNDEIEDLLNVDGEKEPVEDDD